VSFINTTTLELENGNPVECEVVLIFSFGSREYVALNPLENSQWCSTDTIQIFELEILSDDVSYNLKEIDESIFDGVLKKFFRLIAM